MSSRNSSASVPATTRPRSVSDISSGCRARGPGSEPVILVDEYDKPILDALDAPAVARANRDFLRGLYAVVKDCDAHIRFSFITGVSKFSKVSLFSGLNNLTDITLEPDYSAICGYTDADLDTVFAPELGGLDRDQVRDWYNGYSWRGADKVYNPFDILLLFRTREFAAHWFETGTPTFLVDTLFRRRVSSLALDGMVSNAALLSTFDVDDMPTEALLFQTGYLTIERSEPRGAEMFYRLGYPNREVRQSLNRSLLNHMTGDASRPVAHSARLYDLLLVNDFTGLAALVESFFASIPYEWYTNNDIASYEGFYASVFYSYFEPLERRIRHGVVGRRENELLPQVGQHESLVVGGEHYRDAGRQIVDEWVARRIDAQYLAVALEADLDCYPTLAHPGEELVRFWIGV